jgi:ribonuclease Z
VKLHLPQTSITFLGTSAAWPTAFRNVAATAIKWGGEVLLFDCGEGTQRQFQRSDLSYMSVSKVFITHLHGDHHYGLPGLLKTMALNERTEPLEVYGPPGLAELMGIYDRIAPVRAQFQIHVKELRHGDVVKGEAYTVHAAKLDHRVFNLGYAFVEPDRPGRFDKPKALELGVPEGPLFRQLQMGRDVTTPKGQKVRSADIIGPPRKGRRIVITGDTGPCQNLVDLATSADILIAEATYCQDMAEKAVEFGHMTAADAAKTASQARVGRLILTHVSARYTDTAMHLEEARAHFPGTEVAKDLMTVEVPLVE